ncbi:MULTISPECIES: hypothetical protein [Bacillaceae]|uniref:hypothetical protein n=1 Tax=Bacillaceae TaxID=186817 RepID=UPI001BDDE954|nr:MULTISPECIES: hypothetical protein [Bacillaceae]MDX8362060.1 hypothetical protein [Cytobacillus sp. IB215316]
MEYTDKDYDKLLAILAQLQAQFQAQLQLQAEIQAQLQAQLQAQAQAQAQAQVDKDKIWVKNGTASIELPDWWCDKGDA